MGVDVYLEWKRKGEEGEASVAEIPHRNHGKDGYLREPYHGTPYVTRFLFQEVFEAPVHESDSQYLTASIQAATLRKRCRDAVALVVLRDLKLYRGGHDPSKVGIPPLTSGDEMAPSSWPDDYRTALEQRLSQVLGEFWGQRNDEVLLEEARGALLLDRARGVPLPTAAHEIEDFVALAERVEAEGNEIQIVISA